LLAAGDLVAEDLTASFYIKPVSFALVVVCRFASSGSYQVYQRRFGCCCVSVRQSFLIERRCSAKRVLVLNLFVLKAERAGWFPLEF